MHECRTRSSFIHFRQSLVDRIKTSPRPGSIYIVPLHSPKRFTSTHCLLSVQASNSITVTIQLDTADPSQLSLEENERPSVKFDGYPMSNVHESLFGLILSDVS